jgi:6,7-dimethyl-8-ribityllumazine synthase
MKKHHVGSLVAENLRFGVVVARFNDLVTKLLLEGAIEAYTRHGAGADDIEVLHPTAPPTPEVCLRRPALPVALTTYQLAAV